jgi:hypothetical protein
MEEFAAVRLAGCPVPGRPRLACPLSGGRWLVDYILEGDQPEQRELLVVDQALQPLWRLRPPPEFPYWLGNHAVADDLSLGALCLHRELRLVDHHGGLVARFPYPTEHNRGDARFTDDGYLAVRFAGRDENLVLNAEGEVVHRWVQSALGEAGGCAFTVDGRSLWAVVPHLLDRERQQDELWLIELATRRVLDRQPVASGARWVRLCRHPDGQAVGVCWAHAAAGRVQLQLPDVAGVCRTFILADASTLPFPSGTTTRRLPEILPS